MGVILRLAGLWGVADSVWLELDRQRWRRFWTRVVGAIGEGGVIAPLVAALEMAFSLYLLARGTTKGRRRR